MTCLNLNQTPAELAELYGGKDYYWYLRSPAFATAFLLPLGYQLDRLSDRGGHVLDVGCGEGQLADHVNAPYLGIDGSETAVARGVKAGRNVRLGRFEMPESGWGAFDVVVFGGILEVLVKPAHRLSLVETYRRVFPSLTHLVVYDLERLETGPLDVAYRRVWEYHASADLTLEPDVKRHRKILIYELGP